MKPETNESAEARYRAGKITRQRLCQIRLVNAGFCITYCGNTRTSGVYCADCRVKNNRSKLNYEAKLRVRRIKEGRPIGPQGGDIGHQKTCSKCGTKGHNSRTCEVTP